MVTGRDINREHFQKCIEKLKQIGLPEVAKTLDPANPWSFNPDFIILATNNQALLCLNRWGYHIAKVASEIFEWKIEYLRFKRDNKLVEYFTTLGGPSVPERKALEILVRYFDKYYPGFEADSQEIVFPKAMSAYGAPIAFVEETDAYEAADVLTELTRNETDVLKTEGGYAVILRDECGDLTDYNFACVLGACRVLEDFSVTRKQKLCLEINDEQEGTQPWQTAIGEHYTQQARLEAKMDRLLSLVDGTLPDEPTVMPLSGANLKLDEILLRVARIEAKQRLAEPVGV